MTLEQPLEKLVIASNNQGKLKEINEIMGHIGIEVIPQQQLDIPEAEETGTTFVENALIKAQHASKLSGLPALADDSGIVVPALGGAPGVYSARYAGIPKDDNNNNQKLLQALADKTNRQAMFVCVMALCLSDTHPLPIITEGIWHGEITQTAQGHHGFGYDPIFYSPSHQMTAAELDAKAKNQISHRGQAIRQLFNKLQLINTNQNHA